jgi:hypothetical protein
VYVCVQERQQYHAHERNVALSSSLLIYMSIKNNFPSAYKTKSWDKVFQPDYKQFFTDVWYKTSELKATIVSGRALDLNLNSLEWALVR